MNKKERRRLEAAGFTVGDVRDFLPDLTDEEMAIIEMRVALVRALRTHRKVTLKVSQEAFAKLIGSSQSRVAKMEAGDPSVSLDLLMKALVKSGVTRQDIGRAIAKVA